MVDLIFLPIKSSAGEYPDANGVDRYANNALVGSFSFFRMSFTVLTARSTSPLDREKLGVLVVCLNPHSFAN